MLPVRHHNVSFVTSCNLSRQLAKFRTALVASLTMRNVQKGGFGRCQEGAGLRELGFVRPDGADAGKGGDAQGRGWERIALKSCRSEQWVICRSGLNQKPRFSMERGFLLQCLPWRRLYADVDWQ